MTFSKQDIQLIMTGATGGRLIDCPRITPRYEFINVANMTSNLLYICKSGVTDPTSAIYAVGAYSTFSFPVTSDISDNFQAVWVNGQGDVLLFKIAHIIFSYQSLGYNQCYAEGFAFANGNINMQVQNIPQVTIGNAVDVNVVNNPQISGAVNIANTVEVQNSPGGQLTVAGTVALEANQQVNIGNTPTVAIAANQQVNIGNVPSVNVQSGEVNANIQNAEINTQVVNSNISPAMFQNAIGSYDTVSFFNSICNLGKTQIVNPASNYIKKLFLCLSATSTVATAFVINIEYGDKNLVPLTFDKTYHPTGGGVFHQYLYDFGGSGVVNDGVVIESWVSQTFYAYGYIVTSVQTPAARVNVIS